MDVEIRVTVAGVEPRQSVQTSLGERPVDGRPATRDRLLPLGVQVLRASRRRPSASPTPGRHRRSHPRQGPSIGPGPKNSAAFMSSTRARCLSSPPRVIDTPGSRKASPAASRPPAFQANWARERSREKRSISCSPAVQDGSVIRVSRSIETVMAGTVDGIPDDRLPNRSGDSRESFGRFDSHGSVAAKELRRDGTRRAPLTVAHVWNAGELASHIGQPMTERAFVNTLRDITEGPRRHQGRG